tara:strand:+ start:261 stop:497 length:237 start_codon:yes stop_codon:yes gene_type:complete
MKIKHIIEKLELKRVLIVWLSIYPAITIIQWYFSEHLLKVPLLLRTLILTLVLVPLMLYLLIPFWTKAINKLQNKKTH